LIFLHSWVCRCTDDKSAPFQAAKLSIEINSVESLPSLEYAERSMRGFI